MLKMRSVHVYSNTQFRTQKDRQGFVGLIEPFLFTRVPADIAARDGSVVAPVGHGQGEGRSGRWPRHAVPAVGGSGGEVPGERRRDRRAVLWRWCACVVSVNE